MTALSTAPVPSVRPVPWPRLGWVVWRRYRTMLTATIGILAVIAVYLVVTGEQMRSAYHAVTACRPTGSTACMYKFNAFHNSYASPGFIGAVLMFLPAIIGSFVGAPLLARELETGTFRYAWTQGVGRMRWATAILVSGAIGVAIIMTAFGALISWRNRPLFGSDITPRLHQTIFPETGLAAAGWALAGFATGVLAGLLWRRVVPAIATAFAACFGLEYLGATYRTHYLRPLTTTSLDQPVKALTISQWWTKSGIHVSSNQVASALSGVGAPFNESGGKITSTAGSSTGAGTNIDPVQYLLQHGYTQVTSYQPDSRYWPLQWIEFGWLTALALTFLGTAFWLLRRRPA
jgi:hypothetical protein